MPSGFRRLPSRRFICRENGPSAQCGDCGSGPDRQRGGIIRDLLAGRKPLVLKAEIYAVWAALGGLIVGLGWLGNSFGLYVLFFVLVVCRVCSYMFKWQLPNRSFRLDN